MQMNVMEYMIIFQHQQFVVKYALQFHFTVTFSLRVLNVKVI